MVDSAVTRWYHCVVRCVRRANLLSEGLTDRKAWIENRLRELAEIFAVSVGGYAVLDNQVHLLLRLDPEVAHGWSDEEAVRRWSRVFPPRDKSRELVPVSKDWVKGQVKDALLVAQARERLLSLSWFMKCLKEPLSRMANREDETRGVFFEGRFKSVAILDEQSLLATCTYIDLSPVPAGSATVPVASEHTSLEERVDHIKAQGRTKDLKAARRGSAAGSKALAGLEQSHWLCPIEDRSKLDSKREGMLEGFSLGSYLLLVDYTGRLLHDEETTSSRQVAKVLDRLGSSAQNWQARLEKLSTGRLFGRYFAARRQRLSEVAEQLGLQRVPNLSGCPVT
jgi:hypothetical protein